MIAPISQFTSRIKLSRWQRLGLAALVVAAVWMAGYYFAPMVDCLEAMLPPIPKKPLSLESSFARRGLARLKSIKRLNISYNLIF